MISFPAVFCLATALAVTAAAQPAGEPPQGPSKDKDHGRGGDWRGPFPGMGRPPMRSDGFDKLPEPEKQKVRAALDKVWCRPEVMEARDRVMKANEDFRDAIRVALQAIDPEAARIVERIRPPDHFDPRKLPQLPPPDSADFPRAALKRLEMEMMAFAKPERHTETQKLHERVIATPEVKEAFSTLENSRGEARIDAMQKLRERYRATALQEFKRAREARGPGGERPPPPQR